MRIHREVVVFMCRRRQGDDEVLLLHRTLEEGAYWHTVSGALENEETNTDAAIREVREETGFDARDALIALGHRYAYTFNDVPPEFRTLWDADLGFVQGEGFAVRTPAEWKPRLNHEHDAYRWCKISEALGLLRWPDARKALLMLQTYASNRCD